MTFAFNCLYPQKDVAKAQQELNTVSKDTGGGQADKEQTIQHLAML